MTHLEEDKILEMAYHEENLTKQLRKKFTKTNQITKINEIDKNNYQVFFKNQAETDPYNPGAFVTIISYITAYARSRLAKFIRISGYENFYYADTDSLVVT